MSTYKNDNGETLGLYLEINTYDTYTRITGDDSFTRKGFDMIVDDILPECWISVPVYDLRYYFTEYNDVETLAGDYLSDSDIDTIKEECKAENEENEGDDDDLAEAIKEALIEAVNENVSLYYDADEDVYIVSE